MQISKILIKTKLTIFLVLTVNLCFCQRSLTDFLNNKCAYNTDGKGKSIGVKIKYFIPCEWNSSDGDRPHIVKKYFYEFNGKVLISTLAINNLNATPSKSDINDLLSQRSLKVIGKELGDFISSRNVQIDGLVTGEIVVKKIRDHPISKLFMYSIYYYIIFKDKMIVFSYTAGASNDKSANELFNSYQILFRSLAGKTIILSQWE